MKKNEITPEDSACPVYLEPLSAEQIAADIAEREAIEAAKQAKIALKESVLDRLGITDEEVKALLA